MQKFSIIRRQTFIIGFALNCFLVHQLCASAFNFGAPPEAPFDQSFVSNVCAEIKKREVLLNNSRGRNIVAFLGNTGAGKSTLVNFLASVRMNIDPQTKHFTLPKIGEVGYNPNALPVGLGPVSVTDEPKAIQVEDLFLYDLPGFKDTNGYERNLVNAAFIKEILTKAASVRLVIVSGFSAFEADRGAPFRSMYESVKRSFGDGDVRTVDILQKSSILVVTQVPRMYENRDALIHYLTNRLSPECREILNDLARHNKFGYMYHAGEVLYSSPSLTDSQKTEHWTNEKEGILSLIRGTAQGVVQKFRFVDFDTTSKLKEIFFRLMKQKFEDSFNQPIKLSEIDTMISDLVNPGYSERFTQSVSRASEIAILKGYCEEQYSEGVGAINSFLAKDSKEYIEKLRNRRKERIAVITKQSEEKAKNIIAAYEVQHSITDILKIMGNLDSELFQSVYQLAYSEADPKESQVILAVVEGFINNYLEEMSDKFLQYSENMQKKAKFFSAQRAAANGCIGALNTLGECYAGGCGVPQNVEHAAALYQQAADNEYPEAQFNLAVCCLDGCGVGQDKGKGIEWLKKAADQGHVKAQLKLGLFYSTGVFGVVPNDKNEAFKWVHKAASKGYADAQYHLGEFYAKGIGTPVNILGAAEMFQKAADQGYSKALLSLAVCYENGRGVKRDDAKAIELYQKASEQGIQGATEKITVILRSTPISGGAPPFRSAF